MQATPSVKVALDNLRNIADSGQVEDRLRVQAAHEILQWFICGGEDPFLVPAINDNQ